MKKYIQDGKMGEIVCAEAVRANQCSTTKGWLLNKEKAGVRMELFVPEKEIELIECNEYNYLQKTVPMIDNVNMFEAEINHFVDCVVNSAECIVKTDEAIKLMQIIDAIYMSAQTGKTIYFD